MTPGLPGKDLYAAYETLGLMPTGDPEIDNVWYALRDGTVDLEDLAENTERSTISGMRTRLDDVAEGELIRALRVFTDAGARQAELFITVVPFVYGEEWGIAATADEQRAATEALQHVINDPIWQQWGRHNLHITERRSHRSRQLAHAAGTMVLSESIDDIEAYSRRLETWAIAAAGQLTNLFGTRHDEVGLARAATANARRL
jgi:hypothetical protein